MRSRRRHSNVRGGRSNASSLISTATISTYALLVALTALSVLAPPASAQKSSATCSAEWEWTNNKQRESPCQVAAQLLSLCDTNPSSFNLGSSGSYIPSSSASLKANTCSCNVVAYNLLMACQACQRGSSQSDIPTWSTYGGSCATCSTETGISPGPCMKQDNPGFPSSVRPQKGNIAVPAWALENTSGSVWSAAAARKAASGPEKVISAPAPASPAPEKGGSEGTQGKGEEGNKKSEQSADQPKNMKIPVIICSCLAALILTAFLAYLLRVSYNKRKMKKMKEFGDTAFDKVVPTKKESPPRSSSGGLMTPMKLNFKHMMSRLTIAMPKTPGLPRTPRTPGMAEMPSTPLTARFWNFSKRDTKKLTEIKEGYETESLAEKTVRFQQPDGSDPVRRKMATRRCESVASTYSEVDSYKSASSKTSDSRPASVASVASSLASDASSQATLVTGVVRTERPKLSHAGRVHSVSASVSDPIIRRESSMSAKTPSVAGERASAASRTVARARSQYASIGEWNERVSTSTEPEEDKKVTKSRKSRSSSMSDVDTGFSARQSHSKVKTRSKAISRAGSSRPGSDCEGSISDSDQRETLYLPEELKVKQREAAERYSVASSAPSSTMDHSTSRMKQLFETATAGLRSPNTVDATEDADNNARESIATVSSNSSNVRRLDSIIGHLEFDEMMSAQGSPRTPTKKSWLARMSTRSGRSGPPPSPAMSSAPGFAM